MKKLLLAVCAAFMTVGASAQLISSNTVTHKEGKGYNRVSLSYNALSLGDEVFDKESDLDGMNGLSLAWTKGISVSSSAPLFIETGLGLTYGWKSHEESESEDGYSSTGKVSTKFLGLTVPVNVVYKWNVPNTDVNIAPYVGIYFRGNLLGKTKNEWEYSYSGYGYSKSDSGESDFSWFNDLDDDEEPGYEASRFSFGWNIGLGFEYSKFYVGVSYAKDFNNFISIEGEDEHGKKKDYNSKIGNLSATVGFNF